MRKLRLIPVGRSNVHNLSIFRQLKTNYVRDFGKCNQKCSRLLFIIFFLFISVNFMILGGEWHSPTCHGLTVQLIPSCMHVSIKNSRKPTKHLCSPCVSEVKVNPSKSLKTSSTYLQISHDWPLFLEREPL